MTQRTLLASLAAGMVTLAANRADASCVMPDLGIVWSYPADGQTDVPTNAQVLLLPTGGGYSAVDLDGAALQQGASQFQLLTPPLAANSDHTLTVTRQWADSLSSGQPAEVVTLRFRTGAGPLAAHPPPPEPVPTISEGDRDLSELCRNVLWAADCYDTPPDRDLTLSAFHAPTAWIVSTSNNRKILWPAECGLPLVRESRNIAVCYDLSSVNEIGESTSSGPYCVDEPSFTQQLCGSSGAALPLAGLLSLLAVLIRATRRADAR